MNKKESLGSPLGRDTPETERPPEAPAAPIPASFGGKFDQRLSAESSAIRSDDNPAHHHILSCAFPTIIITELLLYLLRLQSDRIQTLIIS